MPIRHWTVLCLVLAASVALGESAAEPQGFERYAVILDRKPFGALPAEPAAVSPNVEMIARIWRLSALIETDTGIRAGLVNIQNHSNFFLGVGESEEDVELISADYESEEAVVRIGSEMIVIKLQSGEAKPVSPTEQRARSPRGAAPAAATVVPVAVPSPASTSAPPRLSYAERRQARRPPAPPRFRPGEVEQHLQEYQTEVIRQGAPPLPIPLTPAQDEQLVSEGVLPER